ncbi:MAG: cryptochrome/photolyase family protein [Verrucomicrobia bacterium]|nr:cryptochrome/photolyase family protein [Verrucomicrobiota bacterium]
MRNLILVLGDQLDAKSAAFDGFDPKQDAVWMAEVSDEAEHVWSHKARIAIFLSAMRHFRDELRARGITVHYRELCDSTFGAELTKSIRQLKPQSVIVVEPGEWRVQEELKRAVPGLEIRPDRHFLYSREEFAAHAAGRKQLRLEFFYREMRRKHNVLMDGDKPVGGTWNFDKENRATFGKEGPGLIPKPVGFKPDTTTREVLALVEKRFAKHPGRLDKFDWPVTRVQAKEALDDFIANRLADFGRVEDAMWTGQPLLYHSRLSAALNLKLLDPREGIAAAVGRLCESAKEGRAASQKRPTTGAPLPAVEGFVRQLLGWREYVRGVYWQFMPGYASLNALEAKRKLPEFYWTGDTEMNCLREVIGQTLELGFAHHIQRLMVTGTYALLLGVDPVEVHKWYLAVYVDAVEWVELPNVLGMSQYADGGIMASKPYIATGKYIQRMSNYCQGCRFKTDKATGPEACPFTTLYWDFLLRHEKLLKQNQRMALQVKNLARLDADQRAAIRRQADAIRVVPAGASGTKRSG